MSTPNRVLIVGPSWVGDMVMAQALFIHLRLSQPGIQIDVVAPQWCVPLLDRMPEVRTGYDLGVGHGEFRFKHRRQLGRSLRSNRYSRAIVLPRSWKAALVPFFAEVPRRTGYRGESRYMLINDMRRMDKSVLDQTVKRFVQLGHPKGQQVSTIPTPKLQTKKGRAEELLAGANLDSSRETIVLAPGAEYGPAKRWPVSYFSRVAKSIAERGHNVLVLGSGKERALGNQIEIEAESDRVVNLCGSTSLGDAVDLLGIARAAICNDSGLLHVAAAAGTHVVAIYGSSTPDFTPPLTENRTILYRRIDCSPCFSRTCRLTHYDCLRTIGAEEAIHAVEQVLELQS